MELRSIWRTIKQRLNNRGFTLNLTELRRATEEEWAKVTLDEINKAIDILSDKVAAINERGGLPIPLLNGYRNLWCVITEISYILACSFGPPCDIIH